MPQSGVKSLPVALLLAASPAVAADTGTAAPPPAASGSSMSMPPGKVMLPPLPLAKMPDTSMPKNPDLAPLPDGSGQRQPVRGKPGGS